MTLWAGVKRIKHVASLAGLLLVACAIEAGFGLPATPRTDATSPPLSTIPVPGAQEGLSRPPTATSYPTDERIVIGRSIENRELVAWQYGEGPVTLVLVGGIHGGYEFNSAILVEQLAETVRDDPDSVLPGVRLVMIPAVNPDGLVRGRGPEGRFNANGVDLNRNWGCGWQPTSYWQDQTTSPGTHPFSEPETAALRAYLLALEPSAVIFYHSAGEAIFVGSCEETSATSQWLGDLLSEATGYPNEVTFEYYEVFGTADDWLDEQGIPAVTIELADRTEPELARNLAGVMAAQCYFARTGDTGVGPLIAAEVEQHCATLQPYTADG
jgi:predicted deacylase